MRLIIDLPWLKLKQLSLILVLLLSSFACSFFGQGPLDKIKKQLNPYDEYAVILFDMRAKGDFVKSYYHRYKVIVLDPQTDVSDNLSRYKMYRTKWLPVNKTFYQQNKPHLGMVLLSKLPAGKPLDQVVTPGYQYVGNLHYGQWQPAVTGGKNWVFSSEYDALHPLFSMANRPVKDDEYQVFLNAFKTGRAYFGAEEDYGTKGNLTNFHYPDFYLRLEREITDTKSLGQKLMERAGHGKYHKDALEKLGY